MIRKLIIRLLGLISSNRLPVATERESQFLSELKDAFQSIPFTSIGDLPKSSEREWLSNMNRLKDLVTNDNPRKFLRWDVVLYTMFPVIKPYVLKELARLRFLVDWRSRWYEAIAESDVGYPIRCVFYPRSSTNIIHLAYHVSAFENHTQQQIQNMEVIFEFGGGYGCLCRLVHRLGYSGKYIIFDLPAFSALQNYYLKTVGLPVLTLDEFLLADRGVLCVSDMDQLRRALGYNMKSGKCLFIATWSLSEAPISIREQLVPLLININYFLIAYQYRFNEIDNVAFFERFTKTREDVAWVEQRITHMGENSYLFGHSR
jgi:hypothetical protein